MVIVGIVMVQAAPDDAASSTKLGTYKCWVAVKEFMPNYNNMCI